MEYKPENEIPEFMQKYFAAVDEEGQVALDRLAGHYHHSRQQFLMTTYSNQSAFQTDWNRVTGSTKQLNAEEMVEASGMKSEFQKRALAIAKDHGYVEPDIELDPEALADEAEERKQDVVGSKKVELTPDSSPDQPAWSTEKQEITDKRDDLAASQETEESEFSRELKALRERQKQRTEERSTEVTDGMQTPQTDQARYETKLSTMQNSGRSKTLRPRR